MQSNYIPQLDGLRAIAVLLVVLCHFEFANIQGGFIGVDIFFTISGFIITKLIIEKKRNNTFSFKDFYIRRIVRLLPVLLVVVIATTIVSYVIFTNELFGDTIQSAIFSIIPVSNIYFALTTGYWDGDIITKPLLHTWSLSVEEQFYIIWPFLLVLLFSKTKESISIILLVCFILLNVFISQFITSKFPDESYYATPLRLYEFFLGALIVFLPKITYKLFLYSIYGISLLAIFGLSFYFNETYSFPHYWAFFPCLATALCIYSCHVDTHILSNKYMCYIGKLSYTLYLVHWPIWSLYNYVYIGELGLSHKLILLGATFVSSVIIYYLIENPIRYGANWCKQYTILQRFIAILALSMISLGLLTLVSQQKLPEKNNPYKIKENKPLKHKVTKHKKQMEKRKGTPEIVFIGDSNSSGMYLSYLLSETNTLFPTIPVKDASLASCLPFDSRLSKQRPKERCKQHMIDTFDWIYQNNPKLIILTTRLGVVNKTRKLKALQDTLQKITKTTSSHILLTDARIEFKESVKDVVVTKRNMQPEKLNRLLHDIREWESFYEYERFIEKMQKQSDKIERLNVNNQFCKAVEECEYLKGNTLFFLDKIHLTSEGRKREIKAIDRALKTTSFNFKKMFQVEKD